MHLTLSYLALSYLSLPYFALPFLDIETVPSTLSCVCLFSVRWVLYVCLFSVRWVLYVCLFSVRWVLYVCLFSLWWAGGCILLVASHPREQNDDSFPCWSHEGCAHLWTNSSGTFSVSMQYSLPYYLVVSLGIIDPGKAVNTTSSARRICFTKHFHLRWPVGIAKLSHVKNAVWISSSLGCISQDLWFIWDGVQYRYLSIHFLNKYNKINFYCTKIFGNRSSVAQQTMDYSIVFSI